MPTPPLTSLLTAPLLGQGKGRRAERRKDNSGLCHQGLHPKSPKEEALLWRDCAPGPEVPLRRGLTWPAAAGMPVTVLWGSWCFLWPRCSCAGWGTPRLSVGVLALSSGGRIPPQELPPRSGLRGSQSGTRRAGAGCRIPGSGKAAGTQLGRQGEG